MNDLVKIKVLMVEDEDADAEVVKRFIDLSGKGRFTLERARNLESAVALLRKEEFDLILLDQRLPDSSDGDTLSYMRRHAKACPIIVLTGVEDESEGADKVRQGAQDYLVKGHFDAHLLMRVIRFTLERTELQREVERLRMKEQREQELKSIRDMMISSDQGKSQTVRDRLPSLYNHLLEKYGELLELALERRVYRLDRSVFSTKVREYSIELAKAQAGPREIVDIHSACLEKVLREKPEAKGQAYIEEGRLLLLETMGSMVKTYRSISLSEH